MLFQRRLSLSLNILYLTYPRVLICDREQIPYTLFEEIKDGRAISTKYDSKELRFRVPNILVVFSNSGPNFLQSVSKDRWTICTIKYGVMEREPLHVKKGLGSLM